LLPFRKLVAAKTYQKLVTSASVEEFRGEDVNAEHIYESKEKLVVQTPIIRKISQYTLKEGRAV
jgi:hypothetical protein